MMIRYLIVISILLTGCAAGRDIVLPFGQDEPLQAATPESVGMDESMLDYMSAQIAEKDDHKLYSFLVVRNGKLILEEYYNGHSRNTPHDIRSATKSITSLLTGIAIGQSALPGVDSPIMDFLREAYPDVHDKDDITIRHLLTMSAGLDCNDRDRSTRGQEDRMYRSTDWVQYFLSLSRVYSPGEKSSLLYGRGCGPGGSPGAGIRRERC